MWRGMLLGTALLLPGASPLAAGSCTCPCPSESWGWMIFPDPLHGIPDFFETGRIVLDEIVHCPHGISFHFISEQNGVTHVTALVIVRPYDGVLNERLHITDGSFDFAWKLGGYRASYDEVLKALIDASGGLLENYGRIDLRRTPIEKRPVIDPPHELILRWNGRTIPLRGYLDVYYTMVA